MSGSAYGPSIQIARLYQKVSAKTGLVYYVGRMGPARITILPNRNKADDAENNHDMVVLLSQADAAPKPTALQLDQRSHHEPATRPPYQQRPARPEDRYRKTPPGGPRVQIPDDEMPL